MRLLALIGALGIIGAIAAAVFLFGGYFNISRHSAGSGHCRMGHHPGA